jgi:hypothetical protein
MSAHSDAHASQLVAGGCEPAQGGALSPAREPARV